MDRQTLIDQAKALSIRFHEKTIIVKDDKNREFFRFEEGTMVEYDATKLYGRHIKLTDEELATAENMEM